MRKVQSTESPRRSEVRFSDYPDDPMERAKANLLSQIGHREEHFSIYVQGLIYPKCQSLWALGK